MSSLVSMMGCRPSTIAMGPAKFRPLRNQDCCCCCCTGKSVCIGLCDGSISESVPPLWLWDLQLLGFSEAKTAAAAALLFECDDYCDNLECDTTSLVVSFCINMPNGSKGGTRVRRCLHCLTQKLQLQMDSAVEQLQTQISTITVTGTKTRCAAAGMESPPTERYMNNSQGGSKLATRAL